MAWRIFSSSWPDLHDDLDAGVGLLEVVDRPTGSPSASRSVKKCQNETVPVTLLGAAEGIGAAALPDDPPVQPGGGERDRSDGRDRGCGVTQASHEVSLRLGWALVAGGRGPG